MPSRCAIFPVTFFEGFLKLFIKTSFTELPGRGLSGNDEEGITAGKENVLVLPGRGSDVLGMKFKA